MATPFTDIYDVFLSQIHDPVFMEQDTDDELKKRYLLNSIPKFRKCLKDLSSRDDTQFNQTLSDEEILILGTLMVIEYLNPMIISLQNLKQFISSKDFKMTSQANHLEKLIMLRDVKRKEANKLILDYTYNNGNLSDLK